jgi:hypothetical protein
MIGIKQIRLSSSQPRVIQLTVWMFSGLANGCGYAGKKRWLNALFMAANHPLADTICKESARHFYSRQGRV